MRLFRHILGFLIIGTILWLFASACAGTWLNPLIVWGVILAGILGIALSLVITFGGVWAIGRILGWCFE